MSCARCPVLIQGGCVLCQGYPVLIGGRGSTSSCGVGMCIILHRFQGCSCLVLSPGWCAICTAFMDVSTLCFALIEITKVFVFGSDCRGVCVLYDSIGWGGGGGEGGACVCARVCASVCMCVCVCLTD